MEFGVLGPVLVRRDGREAPLGGPRQRSLLAMLLLQANEIVARDRLIEGLWGERPPPTAAHTLDNYASRLRKVVGAERLERSPPGYVLHVEPGELDLDRFERSFRCGREALAAELPREAAASLREALALWRGPALADLQYEPFAQAAVQRLEERRVQALEERVEADLALGGAGELVPELEALVREHPFRERLCAQLMLALYRGGRQAEALAVFQAARHRLAEELGLAPGPELQRVQQGILAQEPGLASTARGDTRAEGRRRMRSWTVAAAIAGVVAIASLTVMLIETGGSGAGTVEPGESRVIALSSKGPPAHSVTLPSAPAALAADSDAVWAAVPASNEVLRLDPETATVSDRIPVGEAPGLLAVGGGSVWAARVLGNAISRIDPRSGRVAQTVRLGTARITALTFGAGRLWVADSVRDALLELDPTSGALQRRLPLELKPSSMAVGDREIWIADYDGGVIAAVDRRTGRALTTVRVGNGPAALVMAGAAVWVANALDSTVSKVGVRSGSLQATISVGSGPTAIDVQGGTVTVANQYSATVTHIDASRGTITGTAPTGGAPTALASAGGVMWVGVRPRVERRGGTLRVLHGRPITLDPALQVDLLPLEFDRLTRSGLVAYNHVSSAAGTQLVPDLAVSLPAPTSGGTVYTFRLRPGVRYSDGRAVRARDFKRAIERVLSLGSEASPGFANIVGAAACAGAGTTGCDLSAGIVTDDAAGTVTFRLREPDPEFLTALATNGLATPVPPDTPFRDMRLEPTPGTGPYTVAAADDREIRLVRNPYFRERSHAAQPDGNPDRIVMRFGLSPEQQIREVEAGRADWAGANVPRLLPALRARYPQRLHRWAIPTTDFFQLNLTRMPFRDLRARKAFNLALDRRKIVRLYGGRDIAIPTCQVLPPGITGYRPYCPYTRDPSSTGRWSSPDLAGARRLVTGSGTRGARVTVWAQKGDPTITPRVVRYVAGTLHRIGYRTRVRIASREQMHASQEGMQVAAAAWGNDTPYGMFSTWFACDGPNVHGWFCDRRVDRWIRRAQALNSTDPRAAAATWARIDRRLVDRAAWVPMINERGLDFVSQRLRNYEFHPYWGVITDQLWLAGAHP